VSVLCTCFFNLPPKEEKIPKANSLARKIAFSCVPEDAGSEPEVDFVL
jgi:hypothetical protein